MSGAEKFGRQDPRYGLLPKLRARRLTVWRPNFARGRARGADYILCADVVYQPAVSAALLDTLAALARPRTAVLLAQAGARAPVRVAESSSE